MRADQHDRVSGGRLSKRKKDRRDRGQEVLDSEVGDDDLVLCHDAGDAVLGDCFHDEGSGGLSLRRNIDIPAVTKF